MNRGWFVNVCEKREVAAAVPESAQHQPNWTGTGMRGCKTGTGRKETQHFARNYTLVNDFAKLVSSVTSGKK